jgi:hypothetical protein
MEYEQLEINNDLESDFEIYITKVLNGVRLRPGALRVDNNKHGTGIDLSQAIALKQGKSTYDRSEEGRELLEIWAWMLDTYMEIQVSDWKEVMKDKDRTENRTWFRGRSLNKKKVNKIIHGALMEQGISLRKIHDHVTAALDCITNQWRIQEPFKRGEIKAAYYSLFGLASVTIITAVKATDSDIEIEDLTDSPQKTADFLYERYSSTARFPKDRLERCINRCWE